MPLFKLKLNFSGHSSPTIYKGYISFGHSPLLTVPGEKTKSYKTYSKLTQFI